MKKTLIVLLVATCLMAADTSQYMPLKEGLNISGFRNPLPNNSCFFNNDTQYAVEIWDSLRCTKIKISKNKDTVFVFDEKVTVIRK